MQTATQGTGRRRAKKDTGYAPLPLVFDMVESQRRAEVGSALALQSERGATWAERADAWLAERSAPFTAEDVVASIGLPSGTPGANKNNAVGAVIRKWSVRKQIVRTGYVPATRVESHGAALAVWQPVRVNARVRVVA